MNADLIERLEKATGPDRELDALVHVIVMRSVWREHYRIEPHMDGRCTVYLSNGGKYREASPAYTASLDAALKLVPEGWKISQLTWGSVEVAAELVKAELTHYTAGISLVDFPAIALCIAALKAREANIPEDA